MAHKSHARTHNTHQRCMPPAPCTNADVSAAIRAHTRPPKSGSKGRHADSIAATSNNADIAEGFEKEKGMERSAIIKRLKIILYMVVKHEAFERYSENCTHASDLGAFHDCPVGTDPGSLTSKSASYTSNQSHRELLECLADAVREHWICLRKGSPRWSTLCDETSDVSGKSQNAIAVKIVLPSGKTAVPFAGLHEMPRSTANHLLNALVHQVPKPVPTPTAPMPMPTPMPTATAIIIFILESLLLLFEIFMLVFESFVPLPGRS